MLSRIVATATVFSLAVAPVQAQQPLALPALANRGELISFLKSADPLKHASAVETSISILTGRMARADMPADLVAQDLVDFAASDAPLLLRSDALTALTYSGRTGAAQRYPRSTLLLAEVYRRSNDPVIKARVIGSVGEIATEEEALRFLRPIAMQLEEGAPFLQSGAIYAIAQLNTTASVAFLRKLHDDKVVTSELGASELATLARNGFRAPPRPRS